MEIKLTNSISNTKQLNGCSYANEKIFNTLTWQEKEAINLLGKYEPEDFIVVCKREAGWKAVEKFSELTGVRVFTKKCTNEFRI